MVFPFLELATISNDSKLTAVCAGLKFKLRLKCEGIALKSSFYATGCARNGLNGGRPLALFRRPSLITFGATIRPG